MIESEKKRMREYDVTELYRQIGRKFRERGADRVILLCSRKFPDSSGMALEIAADGCICREELLNESKALWPEVEITIFDMNEDEHADLLNEAMEDGILL